MKLNAVLLFLLSTSYFILSSSSSLAQNNSANPVKLAKQPVDNNWSHYTKIESDLKKGCIGDKQEATRQKYCECTINAYKTRYTPPIFLQILGLSGQIGKQGPHLVNLMMEPELDRCSAQTRYRR